MLRDIHFDWMIVGLGNPGNRYEKTRHNIGWMVLDYIAEKFGKEFTHRMYFNTFELTIHDKNVAFVKPNIFMNNSGEPVVKFKDRYNISTDKILIVYDEYNFPVGKLHLKQNGSDGGHNGIASVIEKLNTINIPRLRCGIGNDFGQGELIDYVLGNFPKELKNDVKEMIKNASDAIEYIIGNDFSRAMSEINSGKLFGKLESLPKADITSLPTATMTD